MSNLPKGWVFEELNNVSEITRLAGYEYSEYWKESISGEIIALKGYNIGKGKIVTKNMFYITKELSNQLNRSKLYMGDIVFPCVGTIGNAVVIRENDKYHINQNIAKITPKKNLDSDYLSQYLMSFLCKKEIFRFNATTSQPNILVGSLRKFQIPLPPLEEQKKIADILSTVDKKIAFVEENINATEELKKGLMQKLLTEGIGHSEFKDSELGRIPESWKILKLSEICKINMGQSPKSESYNENNIGLPLIQGNADIKNRKTLPRTYTSEVTKKCEIGDIIMTVRAPVGAIAKSYHNACIGRGVCSITPKEDNDFLYHFLVGYEDKWDKLSQG